MPSSTTQIIRAMLIAVISLFSVGSMAAESDDVRTSRSISFTNAVDIDKTTRDDQLKQAEADVLEPLQKDSAVIKSATRALHISSNNSYDITLYDVSTDLLNDYDYDGFYHRISVSIDADTVFDTSYVYAVLYLSYEGGPWNHYATSDNYHIYRDSAADSFTIETELADGYPPGYYDVRVELYDADTGQWLSTSGPYDDQSLSALPLEDSYYDDGNGYGDYNVEAGVSIGVGSMAWLLLAVPVTILIVRRGKKS